MFVQILCHVNATINTRPFYFTEYLILPSRIESAPFTLEEIFTMKPPFSCKPTYLDIYPLRLPPKLDVLLVIRSHL